MPDRSVIDRELVTQPLVGTAHVVLLTVVLLGLGYLISAVVAWVF